MDLLSYGCPDPYVNNSDEKAEVGDQVMDKAYAGSQNPHRVACFLTKMHGNYKMIQDFGNAQMDSSVPADLPGMLNQK